MPTFASVLFMAAYEYPGVINPLLLSAYFGVGVVHRSGSANVTAEIITVRFHQDHPANSILHKMPDHPANLSPSELGTKD